MEPRGTPNRGDRAGRTRTPDRAPCWGVGGPPLLIRVFCCALPSVVRVRAPACPPPRRMPYGGARSAEVGSTMAGLLQFRPMA